MITYKELMDEYMEEGYRIRRVFRNESLHINSSDTHTLYMYDGKYEYVGYVYVWNEVGCIENSFRMYRPVGSGTIVYV